MRRFRVTVNGQEYEVEVEEQGAELPAATPAPQVRIAAPATTSIPQAKRPAAKAPTKPSAPAEKPRGSAAPGAITAPIPGTIIEVKVMAGQTVKTGDLLLVLEAMKMQNEITAPRDGQIKEVNVSKGTSVNTGDALLVIE